MALKNIYFSGPDGAKKTTLAYSLRDFLDRQWKIEAEVIQFPSGAGVLSGWIDLCKQGRMDMPQGALDLMFVADRMDIAGWRLVKDRKMRPNLIYIFDRGPGDGAAYGAARAPEGWDPLEYMKWIERCDGKFLEMFPVDLGFLLVPSLEASQKRMSERALSKPLDAWDSNVDLQRRVRELFDRYVESKPHWHRITVDPIGPNVIMTETRIRNIVVTRLQEEHLGVEGQLSRIERRF